MRVDELIRSACDQTGFDDFADDAFREGLEHLVASVEDEAPPKASASATSWTTVIRASTSAPTTPAAASSS